MTNSPSMREVIAATVYGARCEDMADQIIEALRTEMAEGFEAFALLNGYRLDYGTPADLWDEFFNDQKAKE